MRLTLCVPTRRRPQRFHEMVQSVYYTADELVNIEIVAVMDAEEELYPPLDGVRYVSVPRPTDEGYTRMAGLWTRAWEHGTGDVAMMCADDVMFETKGWDTQVRAAFESVPDRLVMVHSANGQDDRPYLPFVSREWIDAVGFTPDDLQGWFADEWIWSVAAEVGRVIFLPDVMIRHNQFGLDITYTEGMAARERRGGLESMRRDFYSVPNVRRRDKLVAELRRRIGETGRLVSEAQWFTDSLRNAAETRKHASKISDETLVSIHCYSGDLEMVRNALPLHLAHNGRVLVLSPDDAPVRLRRKGVTCRVGGQRGYFGQHTLDRQRRHMEMLLETEYDYFLMNDADSVCLDQIIPRYLYDRSDVAWSNEVREWREHTSPYPKIAMQPPYFLSREVIERMLSVADKPEVRAHPITPFIDWYMLALCEEAGVEHRSFPDGESFPAWGWNPDAMPDTKELGDDWKHSNDTSAPARGDLAMEWGVEKGAVLVHSIKHKEVLEALVRAHARYVARGRPTPMTMTLEQYAQQQAIDHPQAETVRIPMTWDDEPIRVEM